MHIGIGKRDQLSVRDKPPFIVLRGPRCQTKLELSQLRRRSSRSSLRTCYCSIPSTEHDTIALYVYTTCSMPIGPQWLIGQKRSLVCGQIPAALSVGIRNLAPNTNHTRPSRSRYGPHGGIILSAGPPRQPTNHRPCRTFQDPTTRSVDLHPCLAASICQLDGPQRLLSMPTGLGFEDEGLFPIICFFLPFVYGVILPLTPGDRLLHVGDEHGISHGIALSYPSSNPRGPRSKF